MEATDAFLQNWKGLKGYANPPWNLIGRVLMKVENQAAGLVLVAPVWPSQPWYPKLLSLLVSPLLRISLKKEVMIQVGEGPLPEIIPLLAMWNISGNTTCTREFLAKLQSSSWRHGGGNPPNHTIPSARNGSAGVLDGALNPISGLIEDVVNFLAHLYAKGYQYRSLGSYRSAIASMHAPVDGISVGQHPLVSRLLRGVFHS